MSDDDMMIMGATCTYIGDKVSAVTAPSGLPVCPYCHHVLLENDREEWMAQVRKVASDHLPLGEGIEPERYVAFVEWCWGRPCASARGGLSIMYRQFVWDTRPDGPWAKSREAMEGAVAYFQELGQHPLAKSPREWTEQLDGVFRGLQEALRARG